MDKGIRITLRDHATSDTESAISNEEEETQAFDAELVGKEGAGHIWTGDDLSDDEDDTVIVREADQLGIFYLKRVL